MTGEQLPSGGSDRRGARTPVTDMKHLADNQEPGYEPTPAHVDDYDYAEYYMGDGR